MNNHDINYAQAYWAELDDSSFFENTEICRGIIETVDLNTFKFMAFRDPHETDKTVEETIKRIAAFLNNKEKESGRSINIVPTYGDAHIGPPYKCFECVKFIVYGNDNAITLVTHGATEHEALEKNDVLINNIITIADNLCKE